MIDVNNWHNIRIKKGTYYYAMLCYAMMEELPGAFGTSASLTLRLGQIVFSSASLCFMCLDVGFYSYTSFSYVLLQFYIFIIYLVLNSDNTCFLILFVLIHFW